MNGRYPDGPVEILLVEDDQDDVRLTREAFEAADVDVDVDVATDGEGALSYLSRRADDGPPRLPDLVLLGLNLPGVDGLAVLGSIRDDPTLARLPVIVLTRSTDDADVVESYERHVNAYLTKPSTPDEFVALAEAVAEFWFETARLPPLP
ncbi:response regulator [Salinilacihabitans rarus]|uniref:response regulator n=1 Tax=Salinilacihabitans rarus TaxID=2961596 RepID=UPI0020C8AD3F|nr:response regulator [Salinilacihabitans rarus]